MYNRTKTEKNKNVKDLHLINFKCQINVFYKPISERSNSSEICNSQNVYNYPHFQPNYKRV